MPELSYFQEFCQQYKVTEANNNIELTILNDKKKVKQTYQIFSEDKDGNIDMLVYTLRGEIITYDHKNSNPEKPNINNAREEIYKVKRFREPKKYIDKDGNEQFQKYDIPAAARTYPFIPMLVKNKFDNKEKIKTLVLTEGYKKAWLAAIYGLDIIGLSSITHYKQKDTQQMYSDVLDIINVCQVENVILLHDGDCLNISLKALDAGKDIYSRPASFISAATTVRELFKDSNVDIYYSHVLSESVKGSPKGLDDILLAKENEELEVIQDLQLLSKQVCNYFYRVNITNNTNKLIQHFKLSPVESFYNFHADYIGLREFCYKGTKYVYDDIKNECKIIVPGESRFYVRIGDQFYKHIKKPNKYNQLEKYLVARKTTTIIQDHGKGILNHIQKYEAFCNVPNHVNYSQVLYNCYNMYAPFDHEPSEDGDCSFTLEFVKHIFGEQFELGLDYLQLLYQQPNQILPILCLVSKENSTGKSTFLYWLKAIFTQNCTVIGNSELSNDFNASYASKLIIGCEESFIDKKQIVEKIKAMSTGQQIVVNAKGKDHNEIDFFGKFILLSNNEESFIMASKEDERYWVRKISKPAKCNVNVLKDLVEEIPYFLYFLNNRKLSTNNLSRMWFAPEQIKTEALKVLIEANRPQIEQDLLYRLKHLFADTGLPIIYLPIDYIMVDVLNKKYQESYLRKILHKLGIEQYTNDENKITVKRCKIPKYDVEGKIIFIELLCRPYVFEKDKIFTPEELQSIDIKDLNKIDIVTEIPIEADHETAPY